MLCIHGLNKINCPICRMEVHTKPKNSIHIKNQPKTHPLRQNNPFLKEHFQKEHEQKAEMNDTFKDTSLHITNLNSLNSSPFLYFLNRLPTFKNRLLIKRLNEVRPEIPNKFDISRKISLESPEYGFKIDSFGPSEADSKKQK